MILVRRALSGIQRPALAYQLAMTTSETIVNPNHMSNDAVIAEELEEPAPISSGGLDALQAISWIVLLVGIVGGIFVIFNAPDTSHVQGSAAASAQAIQIGVIALGIALIIQSIIVWLVLNILSQIGRGVLEIWKRTHQDLR